MISRNQATRSTPNVLCLPENESVRVLLIARDFSLHTAVHCDATLINMHETTEMTWRAWVPFFLQSRLMHKTLRYRNMWTFAVVAGVASKVGDLAKCWLDLMHNTYNMRYLIAAQSPPLKIPALDKIAALAVQRLMSEHGNFDHLLLPHGLALEASVYEEKLLLKL